ncbi:hypothetical protein GGR51DRAFT_66264 [Nemania sp. FL0031]|nr:hypothetical protein GGR51DRAFT_66264 [Nemania sp. FL0031]
MAGIQYRSAQNLCSTSCPVEHIDILVEDLDPPAKGWPDIRGLHSLNYSRDAWLTGDAIEVAIGEIVNGLPPALKSRIGVGVPGVDPQVFHSGDAGQEALQRAIAKPARRLFPTLKETEWSFLPICTNGNHWVLAVVHKQQDQSAPRPSQSPSGKIRNWTIVSEIVVVDPYRGSPRVTMVRDRLRDWLEQAGGFTFRRQYDNTGKTVVWTPFQRDVNSCGPRAYWAAKQLLDRLLFLHERGVNYDASLWNELSGWFNEDFVRGEMTGRCAFAAVRAMEYRARISVECVSRVKDYRRPRFAEWQEAAASMRPPPDNSDQTPEQGPSHATQNGQAWGLSGPVNADVSATTAQGYNQGGPQRGEGSGQNPGGVPNQHRIQPVWQDIESPMDIDGPKGPAFQQGPDSGNPFIIPRAQPGPAAQDESHTQGVEPLQEPMSLGAQPAGDVKMDSAPSVSDDIYEAADPYETPSRPRDPATQQGPSAFQIPAAVRGPSAFYVPAAVRSVGLRPSPGGLFDSPYRPGDYMSNTPIAPPPQQQQQQQSYSYQVPPPQQQQQQPYSYQAPPQQQQPSAYYVPASPGAPASGGGGFFGTPAPTTPMVPTPHQQIFNTAGPTTPGIFGTNFRPGMGTTPIAPPPASAYQVPAAGGPSTTPAGQPSNFQVPAAPGGAPVAGQGPSSSAYQVPASGRGAQGGQALFTATVPSVPQHLYYRPIAPAPAPGAGIAPTVPYAGAPAGGVPPPGALQPGYQYTGGVFSPGPAGVPSMPPPPPPQPGASGSGTQAAAGPATPQTPANLDRVKSGRVTRRRRSGTNASSGGSGKKRAADGDSEAPTGPAKRARKG